MQLFKLRLKEAAHLVITYSSNKTGFSAQLGNSPDGIRSRAPGFEAPLKPLGGIQNFLRQICIHQYHTALRQPKNIQQLIILKLNQHIDQCTSGTNYLFLIDIHIHAIIFSIAATAICLTS